MSLRFNERPIFKHTVRAIEEENKHHFLSPQACTCMNTDTSIYIQKSACMQYFALILESMFTFYESTDHKIYSSNIICREFINTFKEILVDSDCMMIGFFHGRKSQNMLKALFLMQCNLHIQC